MHHGSRRERERHDMSAQYSEELPDDDRLRAVARHVRRWLVNSMPSRRKASDGREPGRESAA
jgi:hypothetical protein